jgi:hypothetical protein
MGHERPTCRPCGTDLTQTFVDLGMSAVRERTYDAATREMEEKR